MKFNDGTNTDKYLSNINKYLPFFGNICWQQKTQLKDGRSSYLIS